MKFPWTMIAIMVCSTLLANGNSSLIDGGENGKRWSAHTDEQIQNRIDRIQIPFDTKYTPTVKKSIKSYVTNGYKGTEKILGRSLLYFPIFEHYLEA
jgi:membrane-bound lytic murein transglycosylase D